MYHESISRNPAPGLSITAEDMHRSVGEFYQQHPYPHYPLLAKPHWQDGYTAASAFAQYLAGHARGNPSPQDYEPMADSKAIPAVAILGCGEILPYVIHKWEKRANLYCVDLSKRSLKRARFRLWPHQKQCFWIHQDIDPFLDQCRQQGLTFNHIDCYGVLHHMANPAQTLQRISSVLAPQGSVRIMVYNSYARSWLLRIQRALRVLRLQPERKQDIKTAQRLVKWLGKNHPFFGTYLTPSFVKSTVEPHVRFVDTFMHPREARISCKAWLQNIRQAGLEPYALFDRYAELDDLHNPLWHFPDADALSKRIADLRFENNFEFYLRKSAALQLKASAAVLISQSAQNSAFSAPPHLWFSYDETRNIMPSQKRQLWRQFIEHLSGLTVDASQVLMQLPLSAQQRLARLGAIVPSMIVDKELHWALSRPMTAAMETPVIPQNSQSCPDFDYQLQHLLDDRQLSAKALRLIRALLYISTTAG